MNAPHLGRFRNTYAEISIPALKHNFLELKRLLSTEQPIYPMIKANAYGHGAIETALALDTLEPDGYGVALIEEGIQLRLAGVSRPILVFALFDSMGAEALIKFNLTPVVSTWEQVYKLARCLDGNTEFKVHLKFDTGMARLGFDPREAPALKDYFLTQKPMKLDGVCTHFVDTDGGGDPNGWTAQQVRSFLEISTHFREMASHFHCLNSAAILQKVGALKSPISMGARPGIALYGSSPIGTLGATVDLHPVMSVKSYVGLVRRIQSGDSVSYGATWKAERASTIIVVPIGYADGYPRLLSNQGHMLFRGQRVPVVGRVCMDYVMCDVTDAIREGPAQIGEEICVIGRQGAENLRVDELAQLTGTISYEILTGIGMRVPRIYLH